VIEFHDVSRTVPSGTGRLTILHPTSFRIDAGRAVAITGPSGSGKSTLLGLMAGLDTPTSGRIRLDGTDITALSEDELAALRGASVGIVFQFFHLLPSLTALENILVPMEIAGAADARSRARALLADKQPEAALAVYDEISESDRTPDSEYHRMWAVVGVAKVHLLRNERKQAYAAFLKATTMANTLRAKFVRSSDATPLAAKVCCACQS